MKKNKWLLNLAFCIIICIVAIPSFFLIGSKIRNSAQLEAEVYYVATASNTLKSSTFNLEETDPLMRAKEVLSKMQNAPAKDGVLSAMPMNLEIRSLHLQNKIAYVDLDASYLILTNAQQVTCRAAMVWSLTSIPDIEGVALSIEGCKLRTQEGEEIGVMNRDNVCINANISAETTEYAILKLYFTNISATEFLTEERVVEVNANQAREKTVLEQLISGPLEEGFYATVSPNLKVQEVKTTDDGICYVTFNQEFLTHPSANGIVTEKMAVYSIVNSLCALDEVTKVQFLVEGEKIDKVKSSMDYSKPFTEKMILPDNTK